MFRHHLRMRTVIDPGLLSRVMKGAAVCGSEIQIESAADGWHVGTLDPSHTAMTFADVPASCFAEYEEMGTLRFGVSEPDILLRRREDVSIVMTEGVLDMSAGSLTKRVRLMSPEPVRTPPVPETTDTATFELSLIRDVVDAFQGRDARDVTMARLRRADDTLEVIVEDEAGLRHVHATVAGSGCLEWSHPGGVTEVCLSVDMLRSYVRSLPPDELVTLRFATDYPVVADTSLGDAGFRWVCAPMLREGR